MRMLLALITDAVLTDIHVFLAYVL